MAAVSAVVIHFGRRDLTDALAARLLALPSAPEVIVVDNAADQPFDATPYPGLRCIRLEENRGYGFACNRGADAARGEYLFILNNDLDFPHDPLPALVSALEARPDAGVAAPALRFPDGRFQLSYGAQPSLAAEFLERRRQQQSRAGGGAELAAREREAAAHLEPHWVTGACMLFRREAWEQISGFDEAYFFYFEDIDICTRLRRSGWSVLYRSEVTVVHHGGASDPLANPRFVLSYRREQLRYYARYRGRVSFFLLRRYLSWKFSRMEAAGAVDASLAEQLRTLVRDFPRAAERRAFRSSSATPRRQDIPPTRDIPPTQEQT